MQGVQVCLLGLRGQYSQGLEEEQRGEESRVGERREARAGDKWRGDVRGEKRKQERSEERGEGNIRGGTRETPEEERKGGLRVETTAGQIEVASIKT